MRERQRIAQLTLDWYRDSYDPQDNPSGVAQLQRQFKAMADAPDLEIALVLYPLLIDGQGEYPLAGVHTSVAEAARAVGLQVLDLSPIFAGLEAEELWVHPTDHHPNARAHALAAEAIADWVQRIWPATQLAAPAQ